MTPDSSQSDSDRFFNQVEHQVKGLNATPCIKVTKWFSRIEKQSPVEEPDHLSWHYAGYREFMHVV